MVIVFHLVFVMYKNVTRLYQYATKEYWELFFHGGSLKYIDVEWQRTFCWAFENVSNYNSANITLLELKLRYYVAVPSV